MRNGFDHYYNRCAGYKARVKARLTGYGPVTGRVRETHGAQGVNMTLRAVDNNPAQLMDEPVLFRH